MAVDFVQSISTKLSQLDNAVVDLYGSIEDIFTPGDVRVFNEKYSKLTLELEGITDEIQEHDDAQGQKKRYHDLYLKIASISDDLNYAFDSASIPVNDVLLRKTQELEGSIKNAQGMQLAVFSIVLSILAFVLTNAKILAAENIDFKNVLLVNISYILAVDVLFSLIYLFLGPIFYGKHGGLRVFSFIILPIILIAALVLLAKYM